MSIILVCALAWWLVGAGAFVFWWTKDGDLTLSLAFFACAIGMFGPLNFIVGRLIHGDHEPIVIMRRRGGQ